MSNVYFHYRCDYCSSAIPLRGGVTLSVTCKVVGPTSNSKLMVGTRYLSRLLGLPSIHACVCLPHPGTHSMFKHCYCQRYSFTLFAFFSTVWWRRNPLIFKMPWGLDSIIQSFKIETIMQLCLIMMIYFWFMPLCLGWLWILTHDCFPHLSWAVIILIWSLCNMWSRIQTKCFALSYLFMLWWFAWDSWLMFNLNNLQIAFPFWQGPPVLNYQFMQWLLNIIWWSSIMRECGIDYYSNCTLNVKSAVGAAFANQREAKVFIEMHLELLSRRIVSIERNLADASAELAVFVSHVELWDANCTHKIVCFS